jgi:hypothetical protein
LTVAATDLLKLTVAATDLLKLTVAAQQTLNSGRINKTVDSIGRALQLF